MEDQGKTQPTTLPGCRRTSGINRRRQNSAAHRASSAVVFHRTNDVNATSFSVRLKEAGVVGLVLEKSKDDGTALVKKVLPDSQAGRAGMRPGDMITYPGTAEDPVRLPYELFLRLCKSKSRPFSFDVLRRGNASDVSSKLATISAKATTATAEKRPGKPNSSGKSSLSVASTGGSSTNRRLPVAIYPDGSYSRKTATQEEIQRQVDELMELGRQEEQRTGQGRQRQQGRDRGKKRPRREFDDPDTWPRVKHGEWDYVYITGPPPLGGRFGYYDDHDGKALVYFGSPILGDGPYSVSLARLRKPPASKRGDQFFSPL